MADEKLTRNQRFSEIGVSGLNYMGGQVYEEFLKQLKGPRAVKQYREMSDNDPTVGAVLLAIELLMRQAEWTVEGASQDNADQQLKEFVQSCFDDMDDSIRDVIAEIASMLTFGWSVHEEVYKFRRGDTLDPLMRSKQTDGRIGWKKLPIRAQETLDDWEFEAGGNVTAMIQRSAPLYDLRRVPMAKALLFRTTKKKNNPEGRSILRNAYRPWYFKKNIENIEGIGLERDLAGLPVGWVPPEILSATDGDNLATKNAFMKMITGVKRDEKEGILMPLVYDEAGHKLFDFQLMSTGGRRSFNTNDIINRYRQDIAMSVLADFILLGHEQVGSFALASSKTNLFSTAIGAYMDAIADVFNTVAIPRLLSINGMRAEKLPYLKHGDIETVDLKELGGFISALSGSGVPLFPDENLENHLRRQAGLPTKESDEL